MASRSLTAVILNGRSPFWSPVGSDANPEIVHSVMKQLPAPDRVHKATGTVDKINHAKGVVAFAHGPVASMGWPAMTTGSRV